MHSKAFLRQYQAQAATAAAVPPLADNYVLNPVGISDGFTIGSPDLLDMSANGQLRADAIGNPPVDGLNIIARFRVI